jgi:hypothetical protein
VTAARRLRRCIRAAAVAAVTGGTALAGGRATAFGILDSWTCVRWGEENIAWVVHYPEELVDPWVRSEAEKRKLRPEQAEELRKSFSEELRIGSATAVLLSVHGYGTNAVNLSPAGKNFALIDSSGRRVSPIAFEKKLDGPILGLVQGFIFFPLQTDKNFSIAVNGLVPGRETNFAFGGARADGTAIATAPPGQPPAPANPPRGDKEVVVRIPTRKTDAPLKPAEPLPPDPVAIDEDSDLGEPGEIFAPTEPHVTEPPPHEPAPEPRPVPDVPKLAPRQALDIYLKAWMDGDTDKMYSMLSAESQGKISKELFAREAAAGNFRGALRSGYKVSWTGDSARVTVAKKVLFVRTLETKMINFVMEDGSARVSW